MLEVKTVLPAIATMLAAVIAALVAFVTSVLSKEHKVSEFRQLWIDSLRDDISKFLSVTNVLAAMLEAKLKKVSGSDRQKVIEEFCLEFREELIESESVSNRILLRLNDEEHKALIDGVKQLEKSFFLGQDVVLPEIDLLVEEFRSLLKSEWGRVKNGEAVFVAMKRFSMWFTIIGLLAVIAYTGFYIYGIVTAMSGS